MDIVEEAHIHVVVLADGVSSRHPFEIPLALERMKQLGATISSSESVLLELLGGSGHRHFKAISTLVKET